MTHRTESQSTLLHGARRLCASLTLVAGVGFASLLLTSPAMAQGDRAEAASNNSAATFPTAQRMEEGLTFAIAQGELNQEQADMIMRVYQRLSMGLENGQLSTSEALGIMEERTSAIYAQTTKKSSAASSNSSGMIIKITAALEAGDITPAQGAEYILVMQQSIAAEESYAAFEGSIIAAVRSGELSREEAGRKIEAFKKELHDQMLVELKERMIAAIDDGTMTEEEVNDVWSAYKKMNLEHDAGQITRQDYAEAQARMQKMVDAGEITRAQMKTRLGEMRKMIGKSKTEAKTGVTRQDYAEAQASMQKMVDAGEMTEEQMNGRLNRMRKMMGRDNGKNKAESRSRDEASDDCMELRRKLGDAVRAGEMTREEAGEVWRNEGC